MEVVNFFEFSLHCILLVFINKLLLANVHLDYLGEKLLNLLSLLQGVVFLTQHKQVFDNRLLRLLRQEHLNLVQDEL